MIYLDTSALIKLYLLEPSSEQVNDLVTKQDDALPIRELQEAELVNALRVKVFWGGITESNAEKLIGSFQNRKAGGLYFYPDSDRVRLLPCLHTVSKHTQSLGCRTLDILHVSCAFLIDANPFVSFDVKQCKLAELVGLNVVGP